MKTKYTVLVLLITVLCLVFLPADASAAEAQSGTCGNLYWEYADGTLSISGSGPMEDYLTVLDPPWRHLQQEVHTIYIDEGVTTIGENTFFKFKNLTTLRLPDSLTKIGFAAFVGCENLTWIFNANLEQAIPDNVQIIDIAAFADCVSIPYLDLGQGVQIIGSSAFSECHSLSQILLSPALTEIQNSAFYKCDNLTELFIPASVTTIGEWAFYGCTGLVTVRFAGDAPTFENGVFGSDSVPICAYAYYREGNSTWQSILQDPDFGHLIWQPVPAQYIAAGRCGTDVMWGLEPNGRLTLYGTGPMYHYDTIDYPPWYSMKDQITSVFVEDGVTAIGNTAFYKCTQIARVTLPDSITFIGRDAFFDCDSLTSFVIGANVSYIGENALLTCDSLKTISVSENNPCYTSDLQGCLYSKDRTLLIQVPGGYSGHLEIPYGVKTIGDSAVNNCVNITSVTIPPSVTVIGNSAFSFCRDLEAVVIPASVQTVDHAAFWCCMSLSEIHFLGDAPEFVEDSIFVWVNAVATYPEGNPTWTADKFVHPDSSITWIPETGCFCVPTLDNATFHTLEAAMDASNGQSVQLLRDVTVYAVLEKGLKLDLNGHNMDGKLITNGNTVYGFDSTTDSYTCDRIGFFACTDETGNPVVPKLQYKLHNGNTQKRYLAISSEAGYSFHRFYLGITHITLKPSETAFGYKAAFYGDPMVQDQVTSLGYHLWVTADKKLECKKDRFQNQLTLRLRDFDVVHFGETPIYASVFMTLKGGILVETARTSTTMRQMLETIDQDHQKYSSAQLTALQAMIAKYPIIQTWNTGNLCKNR